VRGLDPDRAAFRHEALRAIVLLFGVCYALIVAAALWLRSYGLEGLLAGFVGGNLLLMAGMWALTVRDFRMPGIADHLRFLRRDCYTPR
jgi:polysaccharide biosynthesis protein PelG